MSRQGCVHAGALDEPAGGRDARAHGAVPRGRELEGVDVLNALGLEHTDVACRVTPESVDLARPLRRFLAERKRKGGGWGSEGLCRSREGSSGKRGGEWGKRKGAPRPSERALDGKLRILAPGRLIILGKAALLVHPVVHNRRVERLRARGVALGGQHIDVLLRQGTRLISGRPRAGGGRGRGAP